MAENPSVADVLTEAVRETDGAGNDPKNMSLESLLLLITTDRLHQLENETRKELRELKERQKKVTFLHKLTKALNTATTPKGTFDMTNLPDLQTMFKEAKTLGVDLDENHLQYNEQERERLAENIRMTIEDLNMQNDMQIQLVTRITQERYESYQMARSILKPMHDDKMGKARGISGR